MYNENSLLLKGYILSAVAHVVSVCYGKFCSVEKVTATSAFKHSVELQEVINSRAAKLIGQSLFFFVT